ncbi:Type I phosphodiesterase / nucleotide pyrophosphatase [Thiorhodovibrio winogradskyi]|uniref:Type I phosphodiesterase / nucleotide pyrophosphatase n=1 Tax=Thiorhodovibrio winogradskyi TaxID=77007 RepID=A0ABZ0SEH7_9GAMM|nr:alkaline phosphatase family protein [Thiorhodovibrio winogradskyi]
MIEPNYAGGGIVNLMSSLMRARGGNSDLPEAHLLPARELASHKHLVLIVIDGLGADWLARHSPDGWLARHQIGALTSVFPSTTAAAVGSFLTGVAPAQHGLTGWFSWLRELGCVMKTLPGQPRAGGQGNWAMVEDLRSLFPCPPVFARIKTASTLVSPKSIAHSAFNRAHQGLARLRPFGTFKDFLRQIEQAVKRTREPSYIYAYWSELDHLGHHHGIDSPTSVAHLQQLEQGLALLAERLRGQDACLLITADHGQLDTKTADQTDLADYPLLANQLRLPLCGEPRAAFCYTAGGALEAFMAAVEQTLGARFRLAPSGELLAQGYFGPGEPHPELTHRIGDVILIGHDRSVIRDRLPSEKPFQQIGVHGGLSRAEMLVPLCLIPT